MLEHAMLITFADNDRSHKADQTGFNKIGYVTESQEVIYLWRNRVVQDRLSAIEKMPHKVFPLPDVFERNNVEIFFSKNFPAVDLFNLGLSSILRNDVGYFSSPIKLPRLETIGKLARNDRWRALRSMAITGDLLFTFDTQSIFSKIISIIDRGPWSHCAMYTGDDTVIEALTSGVCERPIEVYADPKYRVGLYRSRTRLPEPEKGIHFARSQIGKRYSYRKAALAGLLKLLRLKRIAPTPNDLAIQPGLDLICYVQL
jgi:hypothetical protein